ncbi:MAG: hypothetical protein QME66_08190 [Candidatus Eisenbacteria bacterium]|nr:hypothetical protein [Candidatus Eisenbacteria bacterium]
MSEELATYKPETAVVSELPESIIPAGNTTGMLMTTLDEREKLYQPVNPMEIEIRPDGLVYLPWVFYHERLTAAFGTEWTLLPDGKPKMEGNLILWSFSLYVRGQFISYAVGQQEYQPTNKTMTYGDAIEGARSNALMRVCKHMGVSLELWKPEFTRDWKARYAGSRQEKGWDGKTKTVWYKKGEKSNVTPTAQFMEPAEKPKPNEATQPKPTASINSDVPPRTVHDRKITFGKDTGVWLSEMTLDKLEWYADMFAQNAEDPSKANYKKHNIEMRECCLKELSTRVDAMEPGSAG